MKINYFIVFLFQVSLQPFRTLKLTVIGKLVQGIFIDFEIFHAHQRIFERK